MKKQIENEIKKLKIERESMLNIIKTSLSIIDTDEWTYKIHTIEGKIEALEWCLSLIK